LSQVGWATASPLPNIRIVGRNAKRRARPTWLSEAAKAIESEPKFFRLRRQHSAVESAINALEAHGLDRCPDHGIGGFKRYVALAVLARNIQRLGVVLKEQEAKRRRGPYKKAA